MELQNKSRERKEVKEAKTMFCETREEKKQ